MKKTILKLSAVVMTMALLSIGLTGCADKDNIYGDMNLDDYIKVGEYKGLTADPVEVKVTEEDVQAKIDEALQSAAKAKDLKKGDKIKSGDTANIDYSGKLNGKEFEGGTAQGYDLEIGSNSFIAGFEDGLIGKKVGEKVSLDLTFPKDYQSKELAGKDVVFDVTINSAKRTETPKYNDEFVKANTDFKTKKEYEDSLKKEVKKEKKEQGEQQQKSQLWSQVMEKTEVTKYPEEIVKKYEAAYDSQISAMAEQYGVEKSQILAQYGIADEKALKEMLKEQAQNQTKQDMTMAYIIDKEGIEISKKDKEKKAEELKTQGVDEKKIEEQTGLTMGEVVYMELSNEKVQDFILDNAKIKDSKKEKTE